MSNENTASRSLSLPMLGNRRNEPAVEEGVDRRGFLTESIRIAVLSVLAASCGNLSSPTGPTLNKDVTLKLSDYPGLAQQGGVVSLNENGFPLAVANLGNSSYGAYSLVCPHQGGLVQWTGSQFVCTVHGARFGIQGNWQGGQPTGNLRSYQTTYDAQAGTLTIKA